jgi:uncharacterized protein YaeQ
MSQGSVLYRFRINVSDVDRSVYERLDLRLARHASESTAFLLTRLLAYALNVQEGLSFSAEGLADPDEPCISCEAERGGKALWIEVGSPSARRLHKAAKASDAVKVYTYRNPDSLLREIQAGEVHRGNKIEVYAFAPEFLDALEAQLERDNEWELFRDQGSLLVSMKGESIAGDLLGPYFIK